MIFSAASVRSALASMRTGLEHEKTSQNKRFASEFKRNRREVLRSCSHDDFAHWKLLARKYLTRRISSVEDVVESLLEQLRGLLNASLDNRKERLQNFRPCIVTSSKYLGINFARIDENSDAISDGFTTTVFPYKNVLHKKESANRQLGHARLGRWR